MSRVSLSEAVWLHCEGKGSVDYFNAVKLLNSGQLDGATLTTFLRELKEKIILIDKLRCNMLISAILNLNWLTYDSSVISEYKSFLLHLVSAHTNVLKQVLQALVKRCFTPKYLGDLSDETIFLRVHEVIEEIAKLVPMITTCLLPVLSDCFPFVQSDIAIVVAYVRNLLHLTTYLKTKRQEILELIISHVIQLDVRVPKQKIWDSDTADSRAFTIDSKEQTLDVLMELVFVFINNVCFVDDTLQWEPTKKLYHDFLLVFNNRIFTAHACGHVQFIVFYMCSLKPLLCENTLDYLWKKVENPNTPGVLRQIGASYLSNLVAHATFVPTSLVMTCMDTLSSWIHSYVDFQKDSLCVDFSRHSSFYAVCQALFYIFVFRNRDLLAMPNGFAYLRSLNFERIVTCQLNPLGACHPNVVRKFAFISRNCQLVYCYTVMEKNQRSVLPTHAPRCVDHNFVDAFFPFDSYVLDKSKRFISPVYLENEKATFETKTIDTEEDDFLGEVDSPSDFLPDFLGTSLSPRVALTN